GTNFLTTLGDPDYGGKEDNTFEIWEEFTGSFSTVGLDLITGRFPYLSYRPKKGFKEPR
ncbi:hypothetical protein KI387_012722, partial [Taxus chinensis]